jgi:hypothetical protein
LPWSIPLDVAAGGRGEISIGTTNAGDFGEVVGYALALLYECLRKADGAMPSEAEVRRLEVQLYPAWHRIARDQPPATLLNILMSTVGYQEVSDAVLPLTACTYLIVVIAVLLPPHTGVDALRTTVYQATERFRQIRTDRAAEAPETGEQHPA